MARQRRKSQYTRIGARTIERIAIAAIAAIATRGSSENIAFATVTIFVILVIIEEFDRTWIWQGKAVTLRSVALGSIGYLRLQRAEYVERARLGRRRAAYRRRTSAKAADQRDQARRQISKR